MISARQYKYTGTVSLKINSFPPYPYRLHTSSVSLGTHELCLQRRCVVSFFG